MDFVCMCERYGGRCYFGYGDNLRFGEGICLWKRIDVLYNIFVDLFVWFFWFGCENVNWKKYLFLFFVVFFVYLILWFKNVNLFVE